MPATAGFAPGDTCPRQAKRGPDVVAFSTGQPLCFFHGLLAALCRGLGGAHRLGWLDAPVASTAGGHGPRSVGRAVSAIKLMQCAQLEFSPDAAPASGCVQGVQAAQPLFREAPRRPALAATAARECG